MSPTEPFSKKSVILYSMKTMTDVQDILKNKKATLQTEYGVTKIGLFGSVVRGETTGASDIDVLVEFDPNRRVSLFDFVRLEEELHDLLGAKVDLVEKEALKPIIGQHILKEVVYI